MFENRKYVIINASDVSSIDFSLVIENNESSLRYNNAGDKTFVKFEGDTPDYTFTIRKNTNNCKQY